MEFKGTKETWLVDGKLIFADDYFQTHIATLSEAYDDKTQEANAKIIAAAPELLEALKDLVRYCEDYSNADLELSYNAIKKSTE